MNSSANAQSTASMGAEVDQPNSNENSGMNKHAYAINGGSAGASRLEILARIMWPETESLLRKVNISRGQQCLDIGCGTGDVTIGMAAMTERQAVGIDMDPVNLDVARRQATERAVPATFVAGRVEELDFEAEFDIVYGRFIMSHVDDPFALLQTMKRAAKPGGVVVVEDVNMPLQVSYPPCDEFQRYIELFVAVVERMGACAALGPKLPSMFRDAGFQRFDAHISTPFLYRTGPEKHIGSITLRSIKKSLIDHHITSAEEIDELAEQLEAFEARADSVLSTAQIFQVWGYC